MKRLRHPIRAIREPFGTAGLIVAVVALIAVLGGSAYALTGADKKLIKKEAKKWSKKFAKPGPAGAQGPQGLPGAAGANGKDGAAGANGADGADGEDGAAGTNGTNGTNGKSVVTGTEPAGANCADGGTWVEVEGSGTKKYACNGAKGADGEEGSPWVAGTAPPNAVLKGTWAIPYYSAAGAGERIPTAISTGVPIHDDPNAFIVATQGFVHQTGEEEAVADLACPGTAQNPTVDAATVRGFIGVNVGVVCVYAENATNLTSPGLEPTAEHYGPGQSGGGFVARFKSTAAGLANGYGSWAIHTPDL